MNNLTAKLGRYKGFILGVGVSALAVSAAWGTWAILGSSTPAHQLFKGNGRLEVQRVEIATKFPGKVVTVEVQEGQSIKAGDVIARMDTTDLEGQLAGVQAMRQRAIQAMGRAQGEVQVQSIKARVAQLEFDNAADLRAFTDAYPLRLAHDAADTLAYLCTSPYDVRLAQERFPKIHFHPLREHAGLALQGA